MVKAAPTYSSAPASVRVAHKPFTRLAGVSHEHATVAEEEYLQIMFWLEEARLPITGAIIARAMQLSAPTVH